MRNRGMLGQYAGFISRAVALIIDIVIVMAIIFVVYWSVRLPMEFFLGINPTTCEAPSPLQSNEWMFKLLCASAQYVLALTSFFAAPLYFTLFYSSTGQTIGMYLMGVRIVRLDGKHMTFFGSLLRWVAMFVSMIPLGLGFLWVLVDDRRQAWHDKLANTCVVYAWRAGQNDFLIARMQRWLSGERFRRLRKQPAPPTIQSNYDLVTIAFPEYERLDDVLEMIQKSIDAGAIHIVNATVLVKSLDSSIAVLAASDLDVGAKVNRVADEPLALPDYELKRIMVDVPPENFVVAVVIQEKLADELLRVVARETAALVRRYDLNAASSPIKLPQMASISLAK